MAQTGKSSVIEQIRALQQQQTELLATAKAEALDKANQAIAELTELGFAYRLVEDAAPAGSAKAKPAAKRRPAEGPCPICGFATEPTHDGRSHRGQTQKAPFTAADLAARGLKKVG